MKITATPEAGSSPGSQSRALTKGRNRSRQTNRIWESKRSNHCDTTRAGFAGLPRNHSGRAFAADRLSLSKVERRSWIPATETAATRPYSRYPGLQHQISALPAVKKLNSLQTSDQPDGVSESEAQ